MIFPTNKPKTNVGSSIRSKSTIPSKRPVNAAIKITSTEINDSTPLKGKIRQLVFKALKHKFGDQLASETKFIEMVDSICLQLEPSINNSEELQHKLEKLLKD